MRFAITLAAFLAVSGTVGVSGQMPDVAEPYKVGTFEFSDGPGVGLVYRDALIVELDAANAALQTDPAYPAIPMPEDVIELIGRYEYGLKYPPLRDHELPRGQWAPPGKRACGFRPRCGRRAHPPPAPVSGEDPETRP